MEVITIESKAFTKLIESLQEIKEQLTIPHEKNSLNEKWLDNQDVCNILNISKRTLQAYRDNGKIPYAQIGSKIYYKASDIEEHLNRHYKPAFDN